MAQQAPQAGRVLNGRYRLEEKLGEGGMGQIWRAEHLILKAPVAVKLVDREAIPDDETLGRFIREAQAAAAIRSPHVVQILDYGTEDKVPFMVMELLDGETLAQRLKREVKVSPQETAIIITHIARAVGRAHEEGIVHRDLKPENVFLVKNDDEEVAKVLDFGVAKVESASLGMEGTRTRTGSILGTPFYMSPEQAQGNKTVDFRSDLWSLAVIAFECLTGKRPFYSDGLGDLVLQICIRDVPVPSRIAAVPLGFDRWFEKGTQRDPDKRFQSARELVESLRDVLGVEARETWATPDVLVTTGGTSSPPEREPTSRSEAVTELATQSQLGLAEVAQQAPASEARATSTPLALAEAAPLALAEAAPEGDSRSAALLPDEEREPALTVQQFGTTAHSRPPRSSSGILWGVAGGALAIGAVIGFAVVSRGESPSDAGGPAAGSPLNPSPRATAEQEARRSDHLEPAPQNSVPVQPSASAASELDGERAQDASLKLGDSGASDLDENVEAKPTQDAGTDAWVKPEWAQPEEEEDVSEIDKLLEDPVDSPKDNPY